MQVSEVVTTVSRSKEAFECNATRYHKELMLGVELSGESPDFFASARATATAALLKPSSSSPVSILDFGCGVGTASPFLARKFPSSIIFGSDIAEQALAIARRNYPDPRFRWVHDLAGIPPATIDLVYCNGVFHHIEPRERDSVLSRIGQLIRPGGHFALWENNPWNIGTRWVMSRIPFDRDAICLSQCETTQRLKRAGFSIRCVQHHFFFPRRLAWLRRIESLLRLVPLGAQYLVLATRPN